MLMIGSPSLLFLLLIVVAVVCRKMIFRIGKNIFRIFRKENHHLILYAIGVMLAVNGFGLMLYGNALNNSVEAQLNSLVNSGQINPGTLGMIVGGVSLGFGVILATVGLILNKK